MSKSHPTHVCMSRARLVYEAIALVAIGMSSWCASVVNPESPLVSYPDQQARDMLVDEKMVAACAARAAYDTACRGR